MYLLSEGLLAGVAVAALGDLWRRFGLKLGSYIGDIYGSLVSADAIALRPRVLQPCIRKWKVKYGKDFNGQYKGGL